VMTAAKDLSREDLLVRLFEVLAERDGIARDLDRERERNEDLRRELHDLRLFRLQMRELTPGVFTGNGPDSGDIVAAVKVWLVFYRQMAALYPGSWSDASSIYDWVVTIKNKAAEYDKEIFLCHEMTGPTGSTTPSARRRATPAVRLPGARRRGLAN
jgi:hypothetical protein